MRRKSRRGRPCKANATANRGERKPTARPCPYRFFRIILPFILQQNRLRLPEKFVRGLNSEFATIATLSVPTGLTWKVTISKSDDKVYFTQGWEQFMKQNSIRYGYFLQFEFRGNHHFRVQIYDLSCCEIEYSLNTRKRCKKENVPVQVKEEEQEEVHEEAPHCLGISDAKCENPSFTIIIQKSYFKRNGMYVPSSFANDYLKENLKKSVKLQAEDGREWHLGCHYLRSLNRVALINGPKWKSFMQENNLDVGDVITFKLVGENNNSITLKFLKQ